MKKAFFTLLFLIVLGAAAFGVAAYMTPPPPKPPVLPPPPETKALSVSLIDGTTGKIIAGKDGEKRVNPASTTKILTCIIALEEGEGKLGENIIVTPRAMAQDGTNLGVRPDMPLALGEMLHGMMLVSGNDAAVAAAETVGGSYDRFIAMMNEKAQAIGAVHSHFANPNGLTSPDHYVTADDMAKIAAYAMKNPKFRKIVAEKTYPMTYRDGMYRIVENRNEFLKSGYAGANGVKTGMTDAAGECLVASAERDGELMIVALYDDKNRWKETGPWLDYGFAAAAAEKRYLAEKAAEPAFYRWMNEMLGRE